MHNNDILMQCNIPKYHLDFMVKEGGHGSAVFVCYF